MIKTYLKKLQDLQTYAFEHGVNMEIDTRDSNTTDPWLSVYARVEGSNWTYDDGNHIHSHFALYDFQSEDENKARFDEILNTFNNFINEHSI